MLAHILRLTGANTKEGIPMMTKAAAMDIRWIIAGDIMAEFLPQARPETLQSSPKSKKTENADPESILPGE